MYAKGLHHFLKHIGALFAAMLTNRTNSGAAEANAPELYAFVPFRYQEVKSSNQKDRVPYPRSGHRIAADSGNLYSFGGYNPLLSGNDTEDEYWVNSYPLFQELWKFNFARKEWTKYPNSSTLPLELASNALLLRKNVLMVYGGTGSPFGYRCSNELFVCRVNDNEGLMDEIHTTGQHPIPAYGQALIYHQDYLYTIGGTTGIRYTCDIHRLNLKTLVWEIVYVCNGIGEYEPFGRYRHEVGFDSHNIYILGGGTATDAYDFATLPAFNLDKGIWFPQATIKDKVKGVPEPRRCHGAVQITNDYGTRVFIVGGHKGNQVFDDLWRLDLETFQWTWIETCTLPHPTYFHAAAATPEGRLLIFGGICKYPDETKRSNTLYSAWLCIPKLSEMCWEAVLHYFPQIVQCNSDELLNMGLPKHFVHRMLDDATAVTR